LLLIGLLSVEAAAVLAKALAEEKAATHG